MIVISSLVGSRATERMQSRTDSRRTDPETGMDLLPARLSNSDQIFASGPTLGLSVVE